MRNRKQCVLLCGMIAALVFTMAGCKNPFLAELKKKEKKPKPQTEITYTVTFNSNGGSTVAAKTGITPGSTITLPAEPTKSEYVFGGWYTDNNTFANKFTTSTPVTANITVYAKWMEVIESDNVGSLVLIPAGTFTMGSPSTEPNRNTNETQHSVTLTKNFYMGRTEVTQEQYEAVMGNNPSRFSGSPASGETQGKRPVEGVSWYDVIVFCNKLSIMEGLTPAYSINGSTDPTVWGEVPASNDLTWNAVICNWNANGYRLPTEAEWEYACRAGTTTAFNTDSNSLSDDIGWYSENSNDKTHEVGKKPANAWGLYDMHGNVREYCWDWLEDYSGNPKTDPIGPNSGSYRVCRGGHWYNGNVSTRSANRHNCDPSYRYVDLGFRLVRPQV